MMSATVTVRRLEFAPKCKIVRGLYGDFRHRAVAVGKFTRRIASLDV